MGRKLVWTEKASTDVEAIVRYIKRRDPQAAISVGLGIFDRAQVLLEHPEAGSGLDELPGRWRKIIFRRWKIVYMLADDDVVIIGRVWPAAMGDADLERPL